MSVPPDDRAFFEQAVVGMLDSLFGAAMRLTRNRPDAEDLVAETVARAWGHLAGLEDRGAFKAWLFRILHNTYISEWRKQRPIALEEADERDAEDEGSFSLFERLHQPFLLWWGDPEQEFVAKLMREDIVRALEALPEAYRVAVVLSDLEGFTYQEIADILQVPVGTVRSRLARGRSALQKALWEYRQSPGRCAPEASEPSGAAVSARRP